MVAKIIAWVGLSTIFIMIVIGLFWHDTQRRLKDILGKLEGGD